jgi:hypothetical protein
MALIIETASISETSVNFYETTQRYIPEYVCFHKIRYFTIRNKLWLLIRKTNAKESTIDEVLFQPEGVVIKWLACVFVCDFTSYILFVHTVSVLEVAVCVLSLFRDKRTIILLFNVWYSTFVENVTHILIHSS